MTRLSPGRALATIVAIYAASLSVPASADQPRLAWDPQLGVIVITPKVTVMWDSAGRRRGPFFRFFADPETAGQRPIVTILSARRLKVTDEVLGRNNARIQVRRDIALDRRAGGVEVVETFSLTPDAPVTDYLTVNHRFTIAVPGAGERPPMALLPQKDGYAKPERVFRSSPTGMYRLGPKMDLDGATDLALPLVHLEWLSGTSAAICTDPLYAATIRLEYATYRNPEILGSLGYRYDGAQIPIKGTVTRRFALWIADNPASTTSIPTAQDRAFERSMDAYFRMALPTVRPGPAWLHDIAMVGYDYLSDKGLGWERDVTALAKSLTPGERRHVALCFHGWYDGLGSYCFDDASQSMKAFWIAFGPSKKIPLTRAEVVRRLHLARKLGFRVLMYFADGMLQDTKGPNFRPEWDYSDGIGGRPAAWRIGGWQGPDTFGPTHARNPADPAVRKWYCDYMRALLHAYGPEVDGFVWDETFYIRAGMHVGNPEPAYADQAMMTLVAEVRDVVKGMDPEKVLLVSDCPGEVGSDVPPYAILADGTYQDTSCRPADWSWNLFPNWRNVLWSCNWNPVTNFNFTRWGVDTFGVPVAISNGWGDDRGPSEWQPWEREGFLRLFRARLKRAAGPRYLTMPPATIVETGPQGKQPSDPVPQIPDNWRNWALASNGSTATASSEDDYGGGQWGPYGLIDGRRDPAGWSSGHGWASKSGKPLPQWAQIDFRQSRSVQCLVICNCDDPKSAERSGKWGVIEFDVQARTASGDWHTIAHEGRGQAMSVFVRRFDAPVKTDAIRILVTRVAPLDGQARLLQIEAWGPPTP